MARVVAVLVLAIGALAVGPISGDVPPVQAQGGNVVKFVYFVEQGEPYVESHRQAIENQARALQRLWFDEFGGTFQLSNPVVNVIYGANTSAWYNTTPDGIHSDPRWYRLGNISTEVRNTLGSNHRYVSYPTTTIAEPRVGANFGGAWMDGDDMLCIDGEAISYPYPDGNDASCLGHVAHEFGHVFGLPHSGANDDCMQFGFYDAVRMCRFGAANRQSVVSNAANAGWLDASPSGGPASTMTVINETCATVELSWLNDGVLVSYGTVAPGETRVQNTYVGHSWTVNGAPISQYHVVASTSSAFRVFDEVCVAPAPTPTPSPTPTPGPAIERGDVNCDLSVTIVDALIVAQYAAGNRVDASCDAVGADGIYLAAGDANESGEVNIVDALIIARCLVAAC